MRVLVLLAVGFCMTAAAQGPLNPGGDPRYLAQVELHSAAELQGILRRAEALFNQQGFKVAEPVVFILHGAEGRVFLRQSYPKNKKLVDLAARLSALQVVDIKVCETWMDGQKIDSTQLLPFVDTVPNGPAEVLKMMKEKGYSYF